MSSGTIVVARRLSNGDLVEVLPDGSTRPFPPDQTDWAALGSMTNDEINAAARTDPDNPPSEDRIGPPRRRMPQVRQIRRAFHLTQEEFAERFSIPLETLRDWEDGKTEPDQATRAYLRVIAIDPDSVIRALTRRPAAE